MHQNIKEQKDQAIKSVCELSFHFPMWLISGVFLCSIKMQTYQDQKLPEKCFNLSKKQINTISNTEWSAKQVDHKIIFTILLGALYTIRAFKHYRASACVMCPLWWAPQDIKRPQSPFWKQLAALLYLLDDRPPSMFQLNLGVYIFYYTRSKLIAR